ncbi:hypothetical protein N7462_010158 [Penicillium macrosclerotiorum]|uniref:uncharacterized protein n=1 Tax=Penicillium macrosclerotiorum TaxID=303699 RepID=UPI002548CFA4|nr:uncharacterized protein N7462_010158 [Penicillium macrosclerotiorum]KAJ5669088.1 hypothetical protein N7462_010158 [Penicillium macrosclerotiorum]
MPSVIGIPGQSRRILDIGSGSGLLVHLFAEIAGEASLVIGVEHVDGLRDLGEANMRKSACGSSLLDTGRVEFHCSDGRQGWPESGTANKTDGEEGKWDVVHVGAAAFKFHDVLAQQLRSPGRLFIPIAEDQDDWQSGQTKSLGC